MPTTPCARSRYLGQNLTVDTYNIEVIKEFVYLGTLVDSSNNTSEDKKMRNNRNATDG